MNPYFHKKFSLERSNISKLLNFVSQNPSADRFQIAEETGIGIGKSASDGKMRPTILYAIYSGLLTDESAESKNDILLSDVGRIIFENDSKLKLYISQWVMHYFLSRTENEILVWSFFVHDFLLRHSEFEPETLKDELARKFENFSEEYIKAYTKILISCYSDGDGLSKVGLVESYEKDRYVQGKSSYPNQYLAAYILGEIWEAKHADKSMVEHSVLRESGHFATTMNLNEGDLQNCLNEMSAIPNVISQRREAPPFMVVKHWTDKFDLLRRAYEVEG